LSCRAMACIDKQVWLSWLQRWKLDGGSIEKRTASFQLVLRSPPLYMSFLRSVRVAIIMNFMKFFDQLKVG
jgi:hypothetical protein